MKQYKAKCLLAICCALLTSAWCQPPSPVIHFDDYATLPRSAQSPSEWAVDQGVLRCVLPTPGGEMFADRHYLVEQLHKVAPFELTMDGSVLHHVGEEGLWLGASIQFEGYDGNRIAAGILEKSKAEGYSGLRIHAGGARSELVPLGFEIGDILQFTVKFSTGPLPSQCSLQVNAENTSTKQEATVAYTLEGVRGDFPLDVRLSCSAQHGYGVNPNVAFDNVALAIGEGQSTRGLPLTDTTDLETAIAAAQIDYAISLAIDPIGNRRAIKRLVASYAGKDPLSRISATNPGDTNKIGNTSNQSSFRYSSGLAVNPQLALLLKRVLLDGDTGDQPTKINNSFDVQDSIHSRPETLSRLWFMGDSEEEETFLHHFANSLVEVDAAGAEHVIYQAAIWYKNRGKYAEALSMLQLGDGLLAADDLPSPILVALKLDCLLSSGQDAAHQDLCAQMLTTEPEGYLGHFARMSLAQKAVTRHLDYGSALKHLVRVIEAKGSVEDLGGALGYLPEQAAAEIVWIGRITGDERLINYAKERWDCFPYSVKLSSTIYFGNGR